MPLKKTIITTPTFEFEKKALKKYGGPVVGIDEAGRGPWAGPVVAAAVILDMKNYPEGLNDSKKLKGSKREDLFKELSLSADIGIGIADVARIDRDNILQATLWAMTEAVQNLQTEPEIALIDGNKCPKLACPAEAVIKGDGRSLSIAAASIVAKVTRDCILNELAEIYPGYGWERNKGYGTAEHIAALEKLNITPHHRQSFKPVKKIMELTLNGENLNMQK